MLALENTCLVIIDIQEKLLPVMAESERVVKNTAILIQIAKALNIPILWCEQVPKALGPTVEPVACHLDGVKPIDKYSFSCCGDETFLAKLDETKAKSAVLCGIEAHVCVFQTAMHLVQREMDVHVVADAISSRTNENKQIAISRMDKEGVTLTSTEICLFELLQDAKHEKFRELSKLIK